MSKKNPPLPAFLITLRKPERFRQAIKVLKELVYEVRLHITKKKLTLTEMDPANVCMAQLTINAGTYTTFEVEEPCVIAVNLRDLSLILKRMQDKDIFMLSSDDDKLRLTFDDRKQPRNYVLPHIDIDDTQRKLPDLAMKSTTTMPSKRFQRAILDANLIGESITFTTHERGLTISSKDDRDFSYVSTHNGATKNNGKHVCKYSAEYLLKIVESQTLGGDALIEYKTDYPLRVTYGDDELTMIFILAPRIESD